MPTISEKELDSSGGQPCSECPEYEGAIWLCGEGYLCERCFARLAGIDENELFDDVDYEVPAEQKAKVKATLMLVRGDE